MTLNLCRSISKDDQTSMSLVIESLTLNSSGSMWVQWLFVGAVAFTGGGGCRAVACGRRVLLLRLRLGGHAAWDAAQSQGGKCRSTGLPLGPGGVRWDPAEVSHGEWIIPAVMYGISLYIYVGLSWFIRVIYIYMWIIYHVLCGMSRMHIQVIIAPFVPGYWDSHGWTHSISRS